MKNKIGIDEAGRGPTLGPLVIGIVHWQQPELPDSIQIEDSKDLSATQRQKSATHIKEKCDFKQLFVPAWVIGNSDLSLPHLEARAIVAGLSSFPGDSVVVDSLGSGKKAEDWISWSFPDRQFRFEAKADQKYSAVSAASILAKCGRDSSMESLQEEWGELGSGYPSDPRTKAWLKNRATSRKGWPPFVRQNWATVRRLETNKSANLD